MEPRVSQESSATEHRAAVRRPVWWIWALIALVLAGGAAAAVVRARLTEPALQGAVLTPPAPAYDFSLRDPDSHQVRLSDFRGKAVALTFLYTHCPDVCPLTAEKLHQTFGQLGGAAGRVAFIAVSVDPRGDTPEAVRAFLSAHHVVGELSYLTGPYAELKRVWAYYYVTSDAKPPVAKTAAPASTAPASADAVGHTSIVYVIDPSGNLRVFLPGDFDPKDLAGDLKILARERNP